MTNSLLIVNKYTPSVPLPFQITTRDNDISQYESMIVSQLKYLFLIKIMQSMPADVANGWNQENLPYPRLQMYSETCL